MGERGVVVEVEFHIIIYVPYFCREVRNAGREDSKRRKFGGQGELRDVVFWLESFWVKVVALEGGTYGEIGEGCGKAIYAMCERVAQGEVREG